METDKIFWVLLTIFGGIFATGIFLILERFLWGLSEAVFGLVGLIWLIRDHLTPSINVLPIKTPVMILASVGMAIFIGNTFSQFATIQRTDTPYCLTKILTEKQKSNFFSSRTRHTTHPNSKGQPT